MREREGRAGEGGARQPARTPDYWSERPRTCVMLRPPLWPRILERLVWKISVLLGALGELVASRGARARSGAGSARRLLLPAAVRPAVRRLAAGAAAYYTVHHDRKPTRDTDSGRQMSHRHTITTRSARARMPWSLMF
jgi:hypothetical protein